jgi:hypothetical protein
MQHRDIAIDGSVSRHRIVILSTPFFLFPLAIGSQNRWTCAFALGLGQYYPLSGTFRLDRLSFMRTHHNIHRFAAFRHIAILKCACRDGKKTCCNQKLDFHCDILSPD